MPQKSVSQHNVMVATVNCKGGTQVSEAEGGCQERWEEGATSSSQERWGGVQLVVLCKISSQRKDPSQPLFYFVPHSQAGSASQGRRKGAPSLSQV